LLWSGCCIHARAVNGSSFKLVTGPRGWFKSLPGGIPNIKPLLRVPLVGYNFRLHSSSNVGHGDAELKPGTDSSDLSVNTIFETLRKVKNFFLSFQFIYVFWCAKIAITSHTASVNFNFNTNLWEIGTRAADSQK
jgi:hypothetical protein